jgi:DNA-binding MarR family transcriptional regulator
MPLAKPAANDSATEKRPRRALDTTSLDASLGYSLRRAQLSTYRQFTAAMEKLEVRPSQFAVLSLIRSNPGLSQAAVSDTLGIQKANFVSLLDRLEERGLTERRKVGGDRRSSALYLTRTGEAFVRKMEAAHAKLEAKLLARLGEKRSRQLLDMLLEFSAKAND